MRWDASVGTASATLVRDGPVGCLVPADDGTVWGCNARGLVTLFSVTTDGVTYTPALAGEMIAPRNCPTGTPGDLACVIAPPPPATGGGGTGDPVDPEPLEVSGGCCEPGATTPAAAVLPLLLAGAKLRRTRRSLARPPPRP
jgi:hypothetical protein